jgi:hypothetical protein
VTAGAITVISDDRFSKGVADFLFSAVHNLLPHARRPGGGCIIGGVVVGS